MGGSKSFQVPLVIDIIFGVCWEWGERSDSIGLRNDEQKCEELCGRTEAAWRVLTMRLTWTQLAFVWHFSIHSEFFTCTKAVCTGLLLTTLRFCKQKDRSCYNVNIILGFWNHKRFCEFALPLGEKQIREQILKEGKRAFRYQVHLSFVAQNTFP